MNPEKITLREIDTVDLNEAMILGSIKEAVDLVALKNMDQTLTMYRRRKSARIYTYNNHERVRK